MRQTGDREPRRLLPSTDRVLREPAVVALLRRFDRPAVVLLVQHELNSRRKQVAEGAAPPSAADIADAVAAQVESEWRSSKRVINASGVILHTNVGRAPLSRDALDAIVDSSAYSDLELDLASGRRGSRQHRVQSLLTAVTSAEAAHVTVSNAAAVLLVLTALFRGREVIVSRGQAVEIGGNFRVPDVMRQSGAHLVEVGTTNRTRLADYQNAITRRTGAILHVHRSNFRVVGFTEDVELQDLARLAHENNLLLMDDNGSGALLDTAEFGLRHEPTPIESIAAGADIVSFSGDKLLGGPQAGIILGRVELTSRMAAHPLARAVRPDKVILAALSATLLAYLRGDARSVLPLWQMISSTPEQVRRRAMRWQQEAAALGLDVDLQDGESAVGGGSLPGDSLPTTLLVLPPDVSADSLREGKLPVLARTRSGRCLLDLRTVETRDEAALLRATLEARSIGRGNDRLLGSSA